MADVEYSVGINTRGAQTALAGLRTQIAGVGAALGAAFGIQQLVQTTAQFESLRVSLGLVFKDAQAGAAAFEQIKDFAATSVFSVQQLTETVIKLKAAGLDPTTEQLKLFADVSSVAADSVGALQAITDLFARTTAGGLGLDDLDRLQDRGIPVFKILAEEAGIARDEISKIGQSAEGAQAILTVLESALGEQFGGASAARANTLSQAISNLGDAFDNLFDTIGEGGFRGALTELINSLTEFISRNKEAIQAIGEGLGNAIRFAAENAKILAQALAAAFAAKVAATIVTMVSSIIAFAKAVRQAAVAGAILQGVTGIGLAKVAAGLAGAAVAVGTIEALVGDAGVNVEKLNQEVDKLTDGPIAGGGATSNEDLEAALATIKNIGDSTDSLNAKTQTYFDKWKTSVDTFRTSINQQTELVQLTEEQANVQRGLNDFQQRYFNTINPLQEQANQLRAKGTEESIKQADQIERQISLISEYYNQSLAGVREELENQQKVTQELERQRDIEQARLEIGRLQRDFYESMEDRIQGAANAISDLNATPLQRQLREINRSIDSELVSAIQDIKKQWQAGLIDGDEYIAEIAALKKAAESAAVTLEQITKAQYEHQRSFSYGWSQAFRRFEDDATNAAKLAGRVFEKTTRSLEDSIVEFAKTGKFEFKDMIADITETLLRNQIQQLLANVFNPQGAVGGLLGDVLGPIGDLLGLGGGGTGTPPGQSANNPLYVVEVSGRNINTRVGFEGPPGLNLPTMGGRTPPFAPPQQEGSFFTGISNAISGITNSISSSFGSVVGGISSTIGGISDLFGGFFANGGSLPAGKFGIVGERGPELITGPANITPMQGTNVTYNINAVDAMSFKQMIARDPEFIHAVATKGGSNLPIRR